MGYRLRINTSDVQDKMGFLNFLHINSADGFYAKYIFRFFTIFKHSPISCEYSYDMVFVDQEDCPAEKNIYRSCNALHIFMSSPEYDTGSKPPFKWEQSLLRNYTLLVGGRKKAEWIFPAAACILLVIYILQLSSISRTLSIPCFELVDRMFSPADSIIMLLIMLLMLCFACFSVVAQILIGKVDKLHKAALIGAIERGTAYQTPDSIQKLVYPKNILATIAMWTDIICMILIVVFLFMRAA